ncbi:hypothetical protein Tco_1499830 [Tanacetum coccineum]
MSNSLQVLKILLISKQKSSELSKALYGLHQAPRAWYERLSTFLLKHGYRRGLLTKLCSLRRIEEISCWYRFQVTSEGFLILASRQKEILSTSNNNQNWVYGILRTPFSIYSLFSDSDYLGTIMKEHQLHGGCQYLGRRLVSWTKQETNNVRSAPLTEAENVALQLQVVCSGSFKQFFDKPIKGLARLQDFIPSVTLPLNVHFYEEAYSLSSHRRNTPLDFHQLFPRYLAVQFKILITHKGHASSTRYLAAKSQDATQTSGGDEGTFGSLTLNRKLVRLQEANLSQAKTDSLKVKAKLKKLS